MTKRQPFKLDSDTTTDCVRLIELALSEDVGSFDLTTAVDCTTLSIVPDNIPASATFVSRDSGIACGLQVCELVVERFASNLKLELNVADGDELAPSQPLATVSGNARDILIMERTCLNFMCRLSGISTLTHKFVLEASGTKAQILDTRKTTPAWRRLEKYAVECGGGANHRMGLYDAIMIKDNHLAMYGRVLGDDNLSITQALKMAREWVRKNASSLPNGLGTIIQIEVDTLEQYEIALESQPDIVLLDNMSNSQLAAAVQRRNESAPAVLLEASGGVDLTTVAAIAATGVDRISSGALTHSAMNFDIGLDWTF